MYASIYQFYDSAIPVFAEMNRDYIEETVGEAKRLSEKFGNHPVFSYVWYRYQSEIGGYGLGYLSTPTLRQMLTHPFTVGSTGVVIFGQEDWAPAATEFNQYIAEHLGPEIETFCASFD